MCKFCKNLLGLKIAPGNDKERNKLIEVIKLIDYYQ